MRQQRFFKNWNKLLLCLPLLLNSCSTWSAKKPEPQKPIIETKFIEKRIPVQPRPKSLDLYGLSWYIVVEDNFQALKETLQKEQGETWVLFAMTPKDYEKLALNMSEIRRYIIQQKEIIEYYEKSIKNDDVPNL